jgi:hypothetical protein
VNRIEKIKISLGKNHLKSRLKSFKRKSQFHNFENAKTAGIIFSNCDEKSFEAIREFATFLKNKNIAVTALGYFPGKKIPDKFLFHTNISFFSDNDLNWYYKPKNASINKFITERFDLFFNLSIDNHFPVHFINMLSNASFKVGMETREKSDNDLMINIDKNKNIAYLIEQIKHYLALINKS